MGVSSSLRSRDGSQITDFYHLVPKVSNRALVLLTDDPQMHSGTVGQKRPAANRLKTFILKEQEKSSFF